MAWGICSGGNGNNWLGEMCGGEELKTVPAKKEYIVFMKYIRNMLKEVFEYE